MKSFSGNKNGFSLLEVMISFGLIAALSLYVGKLSLNINKVTIRLESKVDEVQFLSSLQQGLANPASCTRTLGTYCKNHSGKRVSPEECPSEFVWGRNLKGKVIDDGNVPLTKSTFNDIRSNTIGVTELFLSEKYKFMTTSCEILRSSIDSFDSRGVNSFVAFSKMAKEILFNDVMAAVDATAVETSFPSDIHISHLIQILPPLIFDFSWLFNLSCKGKYSDKLFITNVRVGQLESEVPKTEYSLNKTEYFCNSTTGDKCLLNFPSSWSNLRNSYSDTNCLGGMYSPLNKYVCNDFTETSSGDIRLGQLIFYVEYKLKSDNLNDQDRRRTKSFVIPAQTVSKVNGAMSGAPDQSGTYISKCGLHIGEYQAPKDFYDSTFIDLDSLTLLNKKTNTPKKTDSKKVDVDKKDIRDVDVPVVELPI